MKTLISIFVLSLVPIVTWSDFSCPAGENIVCIEEADTICPDYAKCVADNAICLDEHACESDRGYICGSEYDELMNDYQKAVDQYNQLISDNVALREKRLQQKNCVRNASSLLEARRCVG